MASSYSFTTNETNPRCCFEVITRVAMSFSKEFWDNFWSSHTEQTVEWYDDYKDWIELLLKYTNPETHPKALVVGCGNSKLGEKLFSSGYKYIMNVDYCSNVIQYMNQNNIYSPNVLYANADVCRLTEDQDKWYPKDWNGEAKFDIIIDKGTFDSIYSTDQIKWSIASMLTECSKILESKGILAIITAQSPSQLQEYFSRTWEVVCASEFEKRSLSSDSTDSYNPHSLCSCFILRKK